MDCHVAYASRNDVAIEKSDQSAHHLLQSP